MLTSITASHNERNRTYLVVHDHPVHESPVELLARILHHRIILVDIRNFLRCLHLVLVAGQHVHPAPDRSQAGVLVAVVGIEMGSERTVTRLLSIDVVVARPYRLDVDALLRRLDDCLLMRFSVAEVSRTTVY